MSDYRFKILIVDDERSNLEILTRILKPGSYYDPDPLHTNYTLSVVKSGPAALKKIAEDKPDLILLDIIMPGMSGFEVLSKLKSSKETHSIPVIFITGLDNIDDEEKGLLMGAVDYITKPFHNSLVRARVRTHLQIVQQMHMIERLGMIDALTNIPNRRAFESHITAEWNQAIREKKPLSLLIGDIDRFKLFNDKYGHQQGDAALKTVAHEIIAAIKRPSDLAARWGGEEFAVILPDTELSGALNVAEKIRAGVEGAAIMCLDNYLPLSVTISIGAASLSPLPGQCLEELISKADKALYCAKKAGRNRVFS